MSTEVPVTQRLMLVDDHSILREGLRALLELEPGFKVVGEAGSCDEALRIAAAVNPDIVLSDIGMPGRSGLSLVTDLRRQDPSIRIILLTAHTSPEYIRAALDAQADGYVLKDSGHRELIGAIHTVASGQPYMCKAVTDTVLASYIARGGGQVAQQTPLQLVTARERQVLSRIAAGQTNKVVARELSLSVKTVEKHRANMMRKLGLHNAAEVTRFAVNYGLIASAADGNPSLPALATTPI
jgi:DNA-binding NarL/FixJ family response regulator